VLCCHEYPRKAKPFLRAHKWKVFLSDIPLQIIKTDSPQWVPLSLLLFLFLFFPTGKGRRRQMLLPFLKTIQAGATASFKISDFFAIINAQQMVGLSCWPLPLRCGP